VNRRASLASLGALLASACRRRADKPSPPPSAAAPARRAFHYWRTVLRFSAPETRALATLGIERLYLRLCDVDRAPGDPAPRPVAPLSALEAAPLPPGIDVVPVVFLRERALRGLDATAVRALAADVWRAVGGHMQRLRRTTKELQLDCDWSEASRDGFFALLSAVAALARPDDVAVSSTIRLHQIKHRERTGVPPAARGMLMLYNMGAVDADPEAQAIFDADRARAYLGRIADYPLPLDVVLPIWSWVVHVRGRRVENLLQSTDRSDLQGKAWLRSQGAHRYEVTQAAFLDGVVLRPGDFLDVEEATVAAALPAAALVASRLAPAAERRTISLFHLSAKNLARHDLQDLARLFAPFR
jgi:hypothetical protein